MMLLKTLNLQSLGYNLSSWSSLKMCIEAHRISKLIRKFRKELSASKTSRQDLRTQKSLYDVY